MPSRKDGLAFAALAAASLLLACSDNIASPEAGGSPPIQTDRASYTLYETSGGRMLRVEIPYTYHNTTEKTVYLVNCRQAVEASLEKRVDGRWVLAWGGVYAACLSPAIEIAAGTVYADTMIVVDYQGGAPRFTVDPIDGTYRIVLSSTSTVHNYDDSYRGGAWGDPLPVANRISNEFALSK
jgi:hypothetical protein